MNAQRQGFPVTIFFRCTRMSAQMSAFSKEFLCLELSRFKIKNSSRNMISMNSIMVRTLAPMNNPIWPPMLAESKDKRFYWLQLCLNIIFITLIIFFLEKIKLYLERLQSFHILVFVSPINNIACRRISLFPEDWTYVSKNKYQNSTYHHDHHSDNQGALNFFISHVRLHTNTCSRLL